MNVGLTGHSLSHLMSPEFMSRDWRRRCNWQQNITTLYC